MQLHNFVDPAFDFCGCRGFERTDFVDIFSFAQISILFFGKGPFQVSETLYQRDRFKSEFSGIIQ